MKIEMTKTAEMETITIVPEDASDRQLVGRFLGSVPFSDNDLAAMRDALPSEKPAS